MASIPSLSLAVLQNSLFALDSDTATGLPEATTEPVATLSEPFVFAYPVMLKMPNRIRQVALFNVSRSVKPSGRLWNPAADVYRTEDGWLIKVDLAGICEDELELTLDQSSLIIRGCRKDTVYQTGFSYQQMEITYSRFEKTIEFPCPVEEASIEHDYRDGFLIVNLRCK